MREHRLVWRASFVTGGLLIGVGGPMHPGGTMAEMLADSMWLPAHALITVGFALIAVGWAILARSSRGPLRAWWWAAAVATAAQALDYVVHTLAFLDAGAYVAGGPTPIFSVHMALTPVVNPLYAMVMVAVIWKGHGRTAPGSKLYGWVGIAGALAHGVANLLVAGFEIESLRFLFPFVVLLALWHVLAGLTPVRTTGEGELIPSRAT